MIDIDYNFNSVKYIDTTTLEATKGGILTLHDKAQKTGNSLTIYFDDPEQIQTFINALADLYLKMSAKTQVEQSDPDSTDGIKPILIEQIEEGKQ